MNSRDRVLAALDHREPDRVPVDFGAHRSSGIAAIAYARLKDALGIAAGNVYVYDVIQQLAIVEPEVLNAVDADVVELGRAFLLDDCEWKDWVLPDGTPCKIPGFINLERRGEDWYLLSRDGRDLGVQKEGCLYFETTYWPLADSNIDEVDLSNLRQLLEDSLWSAAPIPGAHIPLTDEGLGHLAAGAKALRASTDRAILGIFGGNMFEAPQSLFGQQNYLMYMAMYPDACRRLSAELYRLHLEDLERYLAAVGPFIDVVLFDDDLGSQNGPLMSPAMYRDYYEPYHRLLWRRAKELAPVYVHFHSCGGIEPLLNDLIDAGVDAIDPVQISARDMDARHLKAAFGERLTFWGGGCDTHHILPRGTPDQIREHVRDQMAIMKPGGGFVFAQVHNIMADIPARNMLAMFEAVREYR